MSKTRSNMFALLGLLLIAVAARAVTFNNPLTGYDEQYYLLVGDRMWQGDLPYVDIFDRKPIGLFLLYAAIRALGGDGFLQYKVVALCFVVATAWVIYVWAKKLANIFSASMVSTLYIIWLNFMEGEGGQAPIFYNFLMVSAGYICWQVVETRRNIAIFGCFAMSLVGLAIQIKYTTMWEGAFFGATLTTILILQMKNNYLIWFIIPSWVIISFIPTFIAILYYWKIGFINEFIFCNFKSIFGKHLLFLWNGLGEILAILTPLFALAYLGRSAHTARTRFIFLWLIVSIVAVLAFRTFGTTQYGMPILPPLLLLTAAFFGNRQNSKAVTLIFVVFAFGLSQAKLAKTQYYGGGHDQAMAFVRAIKPLHGCMFVYDSFPALYMLSHSCLPTRWPFPSHLNSDEENSVNAIGIDPIAEVRRILATRPNVIVETCCPLPGGNDATRKLVRATLAKDYTLASHIKIGSQNAHLVYRLKAGT